MTNVRLSSLAALTLVTCVLIGVSRCQRFDRRTPGGLKVEASPADIEWVIVDTHDVGVGGHWVAKLTPRTNGKLIQDLIAGIESAVVKENSETASDGFIVFKFKRNGIQAFNFVEFSGPGVEIRPRFWSHTLGHPLKKIHKEKIGWKRQDSLPDVKVKQIHVWQYERRLNVISRESPSFAPLLAAGSEILKAFDPRWCMANVMWSDPTQSARFQGAPQFIFVLEEPLDMYKLIVWWKKGGRVVSHIRYETFRSSVIALYMERSRSGTAGWYVAFLSDEDKRKWYNWDFADTHFTNRNMGKPDAYKAFMRLLEVYEKVPPAAR